MSDVWNTKTLKSEEDVFSVLMELQGRRWLSRGQPRIYKSLRPSIDRGELADLPRREKLRLERESIDVFRATARFFAGHGEQAATHDDFIALMVLRHYGVPTRLLDWSTSPHVAAYFAICCHDEEDGEIWSFDHNLYGEKGKEQWKRWPETTSDRSGDPDKFDANLTAFTLEEPHDWFIAVFYPTGFPRQSAQSGAYSMTARFDRCHAEAIKKLLGESNCRRYIVPRNLKSKLRTLLREKHGVWRGSLFPDSAGAAAAAMSVFVYS
jgi:FRG domain